jgi:transposase
MIKLRENIRVYLCTEPTDMRRSINGLSAMIQDLFQKAPQSESLFVFGNRYKDKVKCLFWDRNGFVLYYKRLEKGRFTISKELSECTHLELSQMQLEWLLAGLDFATMSKFSELNYSHYY